MNFDWYDAKLEYEQRLGKLQEHQRSKDRKEASEKLRMFGLSGLLSKRNTR